MEPERGRHGRGTPKNWQTGACHRRALRREQAGRAVHQGTTPGHREELALTEGIFRENVRALSDLRMVHSLRRVEQSLAGQRPETVPLTGLPSLYQLPPPPADFIERPELWDDLRAAFHNSQAATITGLTGMGGVALTCEMGQIRDWPYCQAGRRKPPIGQISLLKFVVISRGVGEWRGCPSSVHLLSSIIPRPSSIVYRPRGGS